MSFLAGRLAGTEGAYFFQESKQAVGRLVSQINPAQKKLPSSPSSATEHEFQADVLPEVLRHSLPSRIFHQQAETASSLDTTSKWVLKSDTKNGNSIFAQAHNPLRDYLSLPQVTFGPKRWQLPESENLVSASTANELRQDRHTTAINPEKLKAAPEGLTHSSWKGIRCCNCNSIWWCHLGIWTCWFKATCAECKNNDDIRTKGRDLIEPKLEGFREQLVPLKAWAENMSRRWHLEKEEDVKEKPLIKALSKDVRCKDIELIVML